VAVQATRRAALAAAAALPIALAGCKGTGALSAPPRPAPDVRLLRGAMSAESLLIQRYQQAIRLGAGDSRVAGASRVLRALLAEHQAHLSQLRSRLIPGSPDAARGIVLAQVPARRPLPTAPGLAFRYLAGAEQGASDWLLAEVAPASPSLAQLLASIAASEATHVPVLRAAAR
jgi:hypothetical protein